MKLLHKNRKRSAVVCRYVVLFMFHTSDPILLRQNCVIVNSGGTIQVCTIGFVLVRVVNGDLSKLRRIC